MTRTASNFISEWYGVRLYPSAVGAAGTMDRLRKRQCPFLSDALEQETRCVKKANSSGVCTITTTNLGLRDWVVCPYRVLERRIVSEVARIVFSDPREEVAVYPVVHLEEESRRSRILDLASRETVYLFFQDKLGGEINISGSGTTPELSFDITILECSVDGDWLLLNRYGLFEVQTMDFHGSYRHAVRALEQAIDLHGDAFPQQVDQNQGWLGRRIEGPNIANVFKRTIYQTILKLDLGGKDRCAGVVLGLPEAVWESWAPHLGGMDWEAEEAGDSHRSWVLVFSPQRSRCAEEDVIRRVIPTRATTLIDRAFSVVPARMEREALPGLFEGILRRTRRFYSSTRSRDA